MVPVLEAVPNFSAGQEPALLERLARTASEWGAEVLDVSADADHNRAVLTFVGCPRVVEDASVALARVAADTIDLRTHEGAHPRVGALDVLPFVPLVGLTLADARASARRVGFRLAREVGLPVYFYGEASEPPGRALAELRRGGFEALADGFPPERPPDLLPTGREGSGAHPSAGVTCVGARPLLLAWNVDVEGVDHEVVDRLAADLRERGGGFRGLRALGLELREQGRLQVSMNLEDVRSRAPFEVFRALERLVRREGGRVAGTEVIGMIPEGLLLQAAADRLQLLDPDPARMLSGRLVEHLARRAARSADDVVRTVRAAGDAVPPEVVKAAVRLEEALIGPGTGNVAP